MGEALMPRRGGVDLADLSVAHSHTKFATGLELTFNLTEHGGFQKGLSVFAISAAGATDNAVDFIMDALVVMFDGVIIFKESASVEISSGGLPPDGFCVDVSGDNLHVSATIPTVALRVSAYNLEEGVSG